MLVVLTTVPLEPECTDRARELVADLVAHARSEDGTVRYHACEDLTESDVLRFVEGYEDEAAAEAHTESEPYRRFAEALPEIAAGEIGTVQFEPDEVQEVAFAPEAVVEALD